MKCIKIENVDGKTHITVERGFWIFKKRKVYRAYRQCGLSGYFHDWIELPNENIVPDYLKRQLDAWKRTKGD